MTPLALADFTLVTCLGAGRAANLAALRDGRSGLAACDGAGLPFATYVGEVADLEAAPLDAGFAAYECRNNRLAALALRQDGFAASVAAARARYGAARIGLFLGTSTSGLAQTEAAYRARDAGGALPAWFDYGRTHNTYALARCVREFLKLSGPAYVVSTACAATSKVFAAAQRMIEAGLCDAAIVGGADTLCATTLFGFQSLGVMSEAPCRPFDVARDGISIGEAAGFVLLERRRGAHEIELRGTGESADAYHMSSPHPQGAGARLAMARALQAAGLEAPALDYINLHGTATLAGDAAEARAISKLFVETPCSSTKGLCGHTLGASGVVEVIFTAMAMRHGFLPGSPGTERLDPDLPCNYVTTARPARLRHAMSNSFGFGGVNCAIILSAA